MVGEYRETDVRVNIWYLLLQFFVSGIHKIQKFFFSFFLFLGMNNNNKKKGGIFFFPQHIPHCGFPCDGYGGRAWEGAF